MSTNYQRRNGPTPDIPPTPAATTVIARHRQPDVNMLNRTELIRGGLDKNREGLGGKSSQIY